MYNKPSNLAEAPIVSEHQFRRKSPKGCNKKNERFFVNSKIKSITVAGLNVLHFAPAKKTFQTPLFFLPGMWSNAAMFEAMMLALGDLGYESYALDLPGHGQSYPGRFIGNVSLDYYVGQAENVLKELGRRVILAGHSMGGLLSAKIAEKNRFVVGYVGITIAPSRGVMMGFETMKRIWKYLPELLFNSEIELSAADATAVLFNTFSGERLVKCLMKMGKESGKAGRQLALGRYSVKKLSCPALIIGALHDKITPHQKTMAMKIVSNPSKGMDYDEVNCSHMVMLDENYLEVVMAMHRWLRRNFAMNYLLRPLSMSKIEQTK